MLEATLAMVIAIPVFAVILIVGCLIFRASIKAFFGWIAEKCNNAVRKIKLQHGAIDDLLTNRIAEFVQHDIFEKIVNNHDGIEKICELSKTNKAEYETRKQEYLMKCMNDGVSLDGTDAKDLKLLNKVYTTHLKLDLVFNRLNFFFNEEFFKCNEDAAKTNQANKKSGKLQKHSMAHASFFKENREKLAQYRADMSVEEKIETLREIMKLEKKSKSPNFTTVEAAFQRVTDSLQQMIGKEGERMRQKFMQKYCHEYKPSKNIPKNGANVHSMFLAKVAKPKMGNEKERWEQMKKYLMIYRNAFVQPNLHNDFASITEQDSKNIFPALMTFFQSHENVLSNENFALLEKKFLDRKQLIGDIYNLLDVCIFKMSENKKTKRHESMVRESALENLAEVLPYLKHYLNLDNDFIKNIKKCSVENFLIKLSQNFDEKSPEYQGIYVPLQEKLDEMMGLTLEGIDQKNLIRQARVESELSQQNSSTTQTGVKKTGLIAQAQQKVTHAVHEAKERVENLLHVGEPGEKWRKEKKLAKVEQKKVEEQKKLQAQQQIVAIKKAAAEIKQERQDLKNQAKFDKKTKVDSHYIDEQHERLIPEVKTEIDSRNLQIFKNLYAIFFKEKHGILHVRRTPNDHLLKAIHDEQIGIIFTELEIGQMKQKEYTKTERVKAGWKLKKQEKNRKEFFAIFLEILRQKFCDQNDLIIDKEKYEQIYLPLFRSYCKYYNVTPSTEIALNGKQVIDRLGNAELYEAANSNDFENSQEQMELQKISTSPDLSKLDENEPLPTDCWMGVFDDQEVANESITPTELPQVNGQQAEQGSA